MGDNGSKIRHETVDKTDPKARDKGLQKAREENEQRMRELQDEMVRERDQALEEARERALSDDIEQRNRLDRQKREREENERKRKEEEELLRLKTLLMDYEFQRNPRSQKEAFQELDVEDIDVVRIALIGPTGSGKTSLIGTLQMALSGQQTAFEMGTGREGTILLEEYPMQNNISIVDTRGFFEGDEQLMDECLNIMSGRIRPAEEIRRNYDLQPEGASKKVVTSVEHAQAFSKYAHAVIFVVKANDPRLNDGKYKETLKKIREHFRKDGYAPVTVITYLDKLKNEDEKEQAFDQASAATGSPSDRTYFITNYTKDRAKASLVTERTALDVLDHVLLSAERFIRIRKLREKNQRERDGGTEATGCEDETVEHFFARLQKQHHWPDKERVKAVVTALRQREVNTVSVLKELWEEIKSELKLTMGMRVVLEDEMKKM